MKKVIVVTRAFRDEPIVRKSIESVLNQTYKELVYYLWISKETKSVAEEYVKKDKRVKLLSQEEWPDGSRFCDIFCDLVKKEEADYLCEVDADDLLVNIFIEKMVCFLETNQLDIAFCDRAYFWNEDQVYYKREYAPSIIVSDEETLRSNFQDLYVGIRTVWGTLFTANCLLQGDYSLLPEDPKLRIYGGDTMLILTILRTCKRIGFLTEQLYLYNIKQGISNNYIKERCDSDVFLYRFAKKYLEDMNADSVENTHFLYLVLFHATEDTFKVILNSKKEISEKLQDIARICEYEEVQESFDRWKSICDYKNSKESPLELVFRDKSLNATLSRDDYTNLINIYKAYNVKLRNVDLSEFFTEWITDYEGLEHLYKKNSIYSIMYLLAQLPLMSERKMLEALYLMYNLCDVPWFKRYLGNYLFVCDARKVLLQILKQDKQCFLEELNVKLETSAEFLPQYIELYKDYAASLDDGELYVDAWLLQIEYLVAIDNLEIAEKEVSEIIELGVENERVRQIVKEIKERM